MNILARLQNAIHMESAAHSPRTTEAIEAMRAAQEVIERLTAALTTLASNAVDFSPEGDWRDEALAMAAFAGAALNIHKAGE